MFVRSLADGDGSKGLLGCTGGFSGAAAPSGDVGGLLLGVALNVDGLLGGLVVGGVSPVEGSPEGAADEGLALKPLALG